MTRSERASDGRVAIVTGGGSGIGRAVAGALAARDYHCVLTGRRAERLSETLAGLVTPGSHITIDLRSEGSAEQIVSRTLGDHGRIDVLVHAAGVFQKSDVADTDPDIWSEVLDVNLGAVMRLTRAAWPALGATGGQVVLISSIAATQAFPGNSAYAASKGGLNALGGVLRLEGRAHGVRIITVCPGQTDTGLWDGKAPDEVRARMMDPVSVGGLVADLIELDRNIDVDPVFIRPVVDPWTVDSPPADDR
jgi:NAD(P)-dependent dehydrogenase (short-subunit alcohol dehydrogenase family)